MKIRSIQRKDEYKNVSFEEVSQWYDENIRNNKYDDIDVYKNTYWDGKFAGVFQCSQKPVQDFFKKAKPENIFDIATLTSIWRPGPLQANVDSLYLKAKDGKKMDWGDERINKILEHSNNLLIFQESVMELANKAAGFPLDECDNVRKAIMKKSANPTPEEKKKAEDLKNKFIEGCIKNNFDKKIATQLYENIEFYASYGFNKSHAVSYAINSYICAWFLTHYEKEWLSTYLESMSNPDDIAVAYSEVKSLGWNFSEIDINYAHKQWTYLDGKMFMPSFLSCKGIGESAIDEILLNRPYNSIEDLLWDSKNQWKHSKFNKKSLENLIKIKAFNSLNCVGVNKLFSSYKHMFHVLIENYDEIKKTSIREPEIGKKNLYRIAEETYGMEEWNRNELIDFKKQISGTFNVLDYISKEIIEKLNENNIIPINELESGNSLCWFFINNIEEKKTKNNKIYYLVDGCGLNGKDYKIYIWVNKKMPNLNLTKYNLCISEITKNDFGFTGNIFKIKEIKL